MAGNADNVSFERDIRPLFTEMDVDHMEGMGVLLADHAWLSQPENAKRVYDFLTGTKSRACRQAAPTGATIS